MNRPFTGRDAAIYIGGGFALVICVNIVMAVVAARSFPGLIVPSSYVASQKFNGWIEAGRKQKALGWTVAASAGATELAVTAADRGGNGLFGLKAQALLHHPVGAGEPLQIDLVEVTPGRYSGAHNLAPGPWEAEIRLSRGDEAFYLKQRLRVPG